MNKVEISKSGILAYDVEPWAKLAFAINPQGFTRTFEKYGVSIKDMAGVESLIRLAKAGKDRSGELFDEKGNIIRFDTMRVIMAMPNMKGSDIVTKFKERILIVQ